MMLALFVALCASQTPKPARLDSARVRQVLAGQIADSALVRTSDWTLLDMGDSVVLLADGTQSLRLATAQVASLLDNQPQLAVAGWERLVPDLPHLLGWGAAPVGAELRFALDNGRGLYSSSHFSRTFFGEYRHGWGRFSVGAGLGWEQMLFGPDVTPLVRDTLPSGLGVLVAACGPFLCLELQRHSSPVGPESWHQIHLDSLIQTGQRGDFWVAAAGGRFGSAWEQRVVVKLGAFGYRARWCPDLWSGAFQSVGLWDLPAGNFRFGAGLEWSEHRAAVRGELALAPSHWNLPFPGSDPIGLDLVPLSFSLAFRRMGEFQLLAQASLRFPSSPPAPRTLR